MEIVNEGGSRRLKNNCWSRVTAVAAGACADAARQTADLDISMECFPTPAARDNLLRSRFVLLWRANLWSDLESGQASRGRLPPCPAFLPGHVVNRPCKNLGKGGYRE